MNLLSNKYIKQMYAGLTGIIIAFFVLAELFFWMRYDQWSLLIPTAFLLLLAGVWLACSLYFRKQSQLLDSAITQIESYLNGDTNARIDCDQEGQLFLLFHSINTLAAVLNAHASKELREKEFLKNTISDISHQLKTPLAALNIYNGLLQDEAADLPEIKEFTVLSEQELDRIETLVQNLLKITKLDAGSITLEKTKENIADMMKDIELHFAYRAKNEHKTFLLHGADTPMFLCDRDWLLEAISNIVKNAFDHTKEGDFIQIEWWHSPSMLQIKIKDTGCGIHPEDLHHIFKRFYRSRFSQDTQGIGLGLPLSKAIIEAHNGSIEVDSELNVGTTFVLNFLITTKL